MWGRGRNKANPGMVPPWGRSSSNKGMESSSSLYRTHGKIALGNGGGGSRRGHSSGDGGRAKVGPADRGRRGAAHPRSEALSSARLHHGYAREGDDMERMGRGGWDHI